MVAAAPRHRSLVLLLVAALGVVALTVQLVRSECAAARREAEIELEAQAAQDARSISDFVANAFANGDTSTPHARLRENRFEEPAEPRSAIPLTITRGRDVEGEFLLERASESERANDPGTALRALAAAQDETRDPEIRKLAAVRSSALHRAVGDDAAATADAREALGWMSESERDRTREALLLRHLLAPTDPALLETLATFVGGEDSVFGEALLDTTPEGRARLATRDLELARIAFIRRAALDPPLGQIRAALADGVLLIAHRKDATSIDFLERAIPPELDAITLVSESTSESTDVRVPVGALLPGVYVESRLDSRALDHAIVGRVAWVVLLVAIVCGAIALALRAAALAAQRERESARAKADFVARVGHDLRTPLTLIRMYGETIATGRAGSSVETREFAEIVVRESERLTRLVTTVLDFARLDRTPHGRERHLISLEELAREVAAAHRPLLDHAGIALRFRDPAGPLSVQADADALRGALGNLIENVVHHAANGRELEVACRAANGCAEVAISDRGPGVADTEIDMIFERFARGSSATSKGTGLGLALVREVARAAGGDAFAHNRPGGGLTCTVRIPLASPATNGAAIR